MPEDTVLFVASTIFELVEDPSEINMLLGQTFEKGELLRWKDAELARAEVNANRDELNNTDVGALADTLPLMPLTDEHDFVIGLFTAAEASPDPSDGGVMRLMTEGVMYARRFPETADEIQRGTKQLSIEAMAEQAICSICGNEFEDTKLYCEHLKDRHATGATRRFKGIRAVGGGAVRRPAGSQAGFNHDKVYMVASHQEGVKDGEKPDDHRYDQGWLDAMGWPNGERLVASVDDESYHATVEMLGYLASVSSDSATSLKANEIADQLRSRFGNRSEGGSMEMEQMQQELESALEKLESMTVERDELQTSNADLEARLTTAEADLQEVRASNEQLEESRREQERRVALASIVSDEEFDGNKEVIMAMSDEAVAFMVAKGQPQKPPDPPETMVAGMDADDDSAVVVTLA